MSRTLFALPVAVLVIASVGVSIGAAIGASDLEVTTFDHGSSLGASRLEAPQAQGQDWCRDAESYNDRDERFCEVRELKDSGATRLEIVDTSNGSISVTGSSRRDIALQVRVMAQAETESDARALAKEVSVTLQGGRVRATGPSRERRRSWWVSYRADVPSTMDLALETSNGSVSVTGVRGQIDADTSNGSLRLTDLGGRVNARSSNGSVHVSLGGSQWDGEGLTVVTSNGSARVDIPERYNARLRAGTRNGSMNLDIPMTVQGRVNKDIETTLGSGGAPIDVRTSNGSLRIGRR
jgi:hypothetical protein